MNNGEFEKRIDLIISEGAGLIKEITSAKIKIDFVHVFSRNNQDYKELCAHLLKLGKVIEERKNGTVFLLNKAYETIYGKLKIIGVRMHDPEKKNFEGAPDFKVNYEDFKNKYLKHCNLIKREDYEMLEIVGKKVITYLPNITLSESLGIK